VVDLAEANLRLAEQLANPSMAIPAPGTRAGAGTTPADTPTGTGPFRFVAYRPGVELRVEASVGHWAGAPELTSLTFRFGPDEDASRLLATRQVDLVGLVPPSALASVSGRSERRVGSVAARSVFLLLNRGGVGEWSSLQDGELRRAVALALDREVVAEEGWPDGEENASLIPPVVLDAATEQVEPLAHDPEAARRILDNAGWVPGPDGVRTRDGRRLTLSLVVRDPALVPEPAVMALAAQLAEVGVELVRGEQGSGGPSPLQRVNAATFDLFVDVRPQDDANPCSLCRFFSIRPGAQLTVAGVVGAGPAGDDLFDQVHVAPSLDSARRVAAELMQVVVAEEVVAVPLAVLPNPWLVSSRVQGFGPAGLAGAQRWESVYLSR
jgi:ABC-type transport system substrate-binding protein